MGRLVAYIHQCLSNVKYDASRQITSEFYHRSYRFSSVGPPKRVIIPWSSDIFWRRQTWRTLPDISLWHDETCRHGSASQNDTDISQVGNSPGIVSATDPNNSILLYQWGYWISEIEDASRVTEASLTVASLICRYIYLSLRVPYLPRMRRHICEHIKLSPRPIVDKSNGFTFLSPSRMCHHCTCVGITYSDSH